MSTWSDKFNSHAFNAAWNQLVELIRDESLVDELDEASVQDLARLNKVLTFSEGIVNKIDPELFPFSQLNTLHQQSQACFNELNAFKGNRNVAHIQNANNHADAILLALQQTPAALYSISAENVHDAVSAYANTISSYIEKYKKSTESGVSELESRIESINAELEEKEKIISELKAELTTVEHTIQQQTSEFNTQYQASENSRDEKFEKAYDKYTSDSDSSFKNLAERAAKVIEVLVKFQDDASKVYGVTINTLQGGAYSSYANEEKVAANWLRIIAATLMLTGVGFLVAPEILLALDQEKYVFVWEKILGRLPLSLVVFVPAFYFAKESSKHRNNEVANRRRQHILTTLDPYIELMDDDKAQELKAHVAKTIFSEGNVTDQPDKETSNVISQLANLAKQIKSK